MSDLSALFPDLPADILNGFDSPAPHDGGLTADGQRGTVTDDQLASYLYQIGSLRAPLPPLVDGQNLPSTPEFANNGRLAPPASSVSVEPPDYGDGTTSAPPPEHHEPSPPGPAPGPGPAGPGPAGPAPADLPPSTPSATPPAPTSPEPLPFDPATEPSPVPPSPDLPGSVPPATPEPEGQAALANLLAGDPALRQLIATYYQQRNQPQYPGPVTTPPPAPYLPQQQPIQPSPYQPTYIPPPQQTIQPQPQPVPQPAFDEFTDPNIRALYEQNARIQQQLNDMSTRNQQALQAAEERAVQVQMNHLTQVVEGAVSQWGEKYQVPPAILQDIRAVAGRMGSAQTYMNGLHPITGLPVTPDPSEATKIALDIAYHSTPSARQMEQQRAIARAQNDATRRAKLGGVGGSSASVPRQQPAPTDAAGRRSSMVAEVQDMFRGEWIQPN